MADKITVTLADVPCRCGGTMEPTFAERYDASTELGIGVVITGQVPGVRCTTCGEFAVSGQALRHLSGQATLALLRLERRLAGAEAKFLRKAVLRIGQEALAHRLGISRSTVARWESADSLSSEHDFVLRALIIGTMNHQDETFSLSDLASLLERARAIEAPSKLPVLEFAA